MDDKTNVRYLGINEVIDGIKNIGEENIEIGKLFENTINSFKGDKSLSSKVITPSMESMIQEINRINIEFKDNCDKYIEFLRSDVNDKYSNTDEKLKDIWKKVSEKYNEVKER